MKERILKLGVSLVLIAVLVAAVVCPITSQAAAKGTTYNVVIKDGSPGVTYISIAGGAPAATTSDFGKITFKMVVEEKAKTEKVKSTGQQASYYPVTILAKSFKGPVSKNPMPGGDMTIAQMIMKKDAKGKLYISAGGDVDVTSVMGKKVVSKIGDGTADPAGSLIFDQFTVINSAVLEKTGKKFLEVPFTQTLTTGKSTIVVKGSKSRLEGKTLPNDDTTKTVPTPLVGQPLDLEKGTGTLVSTTAIFNTKNKMLGLMDYLNAMKWVMTITK